MAADRFVRRAWGLSAGGYLDREPQVTKATGQTLTGVSGKYTANERAHLSWDGATMVLVQLVPVAKSDLTVFRQ
jgi:hypothetical protein